MMGSKQRVFCSGCYTELTEIEKLEECPICESRNFAYGETLVFVDGKFQCECGSTKMHMVAHLDFTDKAVTTYECNGCGAAISTEVHREMPW